MKRIAINYMFISIFIFCLILIDSYGISPDLNTAEISIQLKDKFIEKHKTFNLYLSQTIVNGKWYYKDGFNWMSGFNGGGL